MKIVVINGSTRHGSTWNCKEQLLKSIEKYENTDVTEYVLPKDMPHFCNGCFSCITKGEDKCPHAASISPIVKSMEEAELIVLTSPVYALDVSGQMKALLDHLCFMWVSHRPNPIMFKKVGVTITTTAGAGLKHSTKTMRDSLQYWGTRRIYSLATPVAAMKWEEVSKENKEKVSKRADKMASQIVNTIRCIDRVKPILFIRVMFFLMKGMMKKNTWNLTDKNHWEAQGWLTGSSPFN